jgi:hypothetical protein
MNREAPWKWRAVENEENQNQVSLVSPRPWKSPGDFHIPTAPMTSPLFFRNRTRKTHRKEPRHPGPLQAHSWIRKCCLAEDQFQEFLILENRFHHAAVDAQGRSISGGREFAGHVCHHGRNFIHSGKALQ